FQFMASCKLCMDCGLILAYEDISAEIQTNNTLKRDKKPSRKIHRRDNFAFLAMGFSLRR
ncbi:MAG: hypothetical protein IJQ58_03185, partial [Synergistaceae bacterium]|nr:hypothetical protein [Synergistaceae bacterium]